MTNFCVTDAALVVAILDIEGLENQPSEWLNLDCAEVLQEPAGKSDDLLAGRKGVSH